MDKDDIMGVPPSGSGHPAEPEPVPVSAVPASVPIAGHTPGPWRVDRHLAMIVGPDGAPISGEANYQLAAAAPELLEALQQACAAVRAANLHGTGLRLWEAIIAKTRGNG